MSKKETTDSQVSPAVQRYICKLLPLSRHEKEALKVGISLAIEQAAKE